VTRRLRIAVTGLIGTFPIGGVFWDYAQYLLGLYRLGHDVLYVEDTGKWCYDPASGTMVGNGRSNAAFLARELATLDPDLSRRWFFRDAEGNTYGRDWTDVASFCRSADLFLHISAACWMRDEYFAAKRVAFVDSDPMYTQASVPGYLDGSIDAEARSRVDMLREHDVFFTFAENVGAPDCLIPTELFDWVSTRQPIVLDSFREAAVPPSGRRQVLTTVASWEPNKDSGPVVRGVRYRGKSVEFERLIELPSRSPVPIELALAGASAHADRLIAHGWQIVDAYQVSGNPWVYREFLARSLGEWSVAKNAYVASRSGWFSCRTACYLALGVPAVVQDTGFGARIPTGEGLFTFGDIDEAADAINRLVSEPERHAKAALALAHEYFDSSKVLASLVKTALG
jgi:glycosyltransferase involved in cell wall biosynthesis